MWVPANTMQIYESLKKLPEIETVLMTDNEGYFLTVWTRHRPVVGHYVTPFADEKYKALQAFYHDADLDILERYGVSVVVLPGENATHESLKESLKERGWRFYDLVGTREIWIANKVNALSKPQ